MSAPKKISIVYLAFFLCVICAVATAALAFVAEKTAAPIAKAKEAKVFNGLKTVLPPFDNDLVKTKQSFKSSSGNEVDFYTARKNGKVVGYAAQAAVGYGYGGRVEGLIGLSPEGKITNYIISSHSETPGLGTRVTDRKEIKTIFNLGRKKEDSKLPPNAILDQYIGHSLTKGDSWKKRPWALKKNGGEAEHVTGATVSSNAACGIAWEAVSTFKKHRSEILKGGK